MDWLTLTETLRVSETEDFYFGSASDLDGTTEGRIVVSDRQASNPTVLRADGSLIHTVGGPGEFEHVAGVQVARDDSVFAYDVRRSGLTVLIPPLSSAAPRTVRFAFAEGSAVQMWTLDDPSTTGASIPTEPVPLREPARDSAVRAVSAEMHSGGALDLPHTKRPFPDPVVANDGRLWKQRSADGPNAETVPWWILNLEEQTIWERGLPQNGNREVIQNNQTVGPVTTDGGGPSVVRYRIDS